MLEAAPESLTTSAGCPSASRSKSRWQLTDGRRHRCRQGRHLLPEGSLPRAVMSRAQPLRAWERCGVLLSSSLTVAPAHALLPASKQDFLARQATLTAGWLKVQAPNRCLGPLLRARQGCRACGQHSWRHREGLRLLHGSSTPSSTFQRQTGPCLHAGARWALVCG